jgi:nitroreductase
MIEEELDDDTIMSLFETARWAPSSYTNQPWRFIYAKRNRVSLISSIRLEKGISNENNSATIIKRTFLE